MNFRLEGINKLVAYIRVSTSRQAKENFSLEGQTADILKWAEKNEIEIVKWYADEGVSGHNYKRKQFDLMVNELCEDRINADGVVFYTTNRMARRLSVATTAKDRLKESGKILVSISENLISSDPSSDFVFNILSCANQLQSDQNGQNVKDRLGDTFSNGFYTGGVVPFGYDSIEVLDSSNKTRHLLVVNEEDSTLVKRIFNLSLNGLNGKGMGVLSIAAYLNDNGIYFRGSKWDKNKISRMLNDTTYKGLKIFRKGQIDELRKEGTPIVTEELFDKVKIGLKSRVLKNTKSKAERSPALLTGIAKCGKCGLNLRVSTGKSGAYHYYSCTTKKNKGSKTCTCPSIPRKDLELAVTSALLDKILDVDRILNSYKEIKKTAKLRGEEEKSKILKNSLQLNKVSQRISKLYNLIGDGQITLDVTLKSHLSNLIKEQSFLKKENDYLRQQNNIAILKFGERKAKAFCKAIKKAIKESGDEFLKSLLLATVKEIKVFKEEVSIKSYNYQLVNTVSKTKMGTSIEVPTLVSMWR